MKTTKLFDWNCSVEDEYNDAIARLEEWREIEKERFLENWEEERKIEALRDVNYYGRLLEEEEEWNRRQICESQGLSRWC